MAKTDKTVKVTLRRSLIGEKPKTRSGPQVFAVWALAAATISVASSHVARTKPPLPRVLV